MNRNMSLEAAGYSKSELERAVRVEQRELQLESIQLQKSLSQLLRRRREVDERLDELDKASCLLEGM